ncbi:MAG: family 20 glycosylhydrolase [Crocinitomicaceae bacterium]
MGLKIFHFLLILSFVFACSTKQSKQIEPDEIIATDILGLIPYPQEVTFTDGFFELSNETYLYFNSNLTLEGEYLADLINSQLKHPMAVNMKTKIDPLSQIHLSIDSNVFDDNKSEGYQLTITSQKIEITGQTETGVMRGIQTLRQLFVPSFITEVRQSWYLPNLTIRDYPKFEHRGLLLDVCRHYFDETVVKKYIDALAYYKMNVLHLHLTEDQGWRMPIDKYPLLNEISSWRTDTNGNRYGGYYTKDQLKNIVEYAESRHITIIPEIELPGHSQAALAAYPRLSCNGRPIDVVNEWGVFKEIYCAGNDSTFIFLEDVLSEVMEIFPSEYIHIGGDEAPKFRWEHCKKCQKRMKDEGLTDEHELQSYFIRRIEDFLNKNGRQLIGWDEILEGGLSPNATVQSWRGMEGGKSAAEMNHKVIMSPTSHCYLDYPLESIDLEKIYNFNPIPEGLAADKTRYIIGGECNMWTERVPNEENLDSKVFPRMIGIAEVLWTYPENRNFEDLYFRLKKHHPALDAKGIKYGFETTRAFIDVVYDEGTKIHLSTPLPDLTLKYKWNSSNEPFVDYVNPINLDRTDKLIVQAFRGGQPYGDALMQDLIEHTALGASVTYKTELNPWYPGNGEQHLFDGARGSKNFRDGNWQGFSGDDLMIDIDLKQIKDLKSAEFQFYHYPNAWIFLPKSVHFEWSEDQVKWFSSKHIFNHFELTENNRIGQTSALLNKGNSIKARYLRITIENYGKVPKGHDAEGEDAWLFIDEIVLK